MPAVRSYHRPTTLADALTWLPTCIPLAGGTVVNAAEHRDADLLDLQALRLDTISAGPGTLTIGAMVRLQDLADSDVVPPLLRDLARRELPSTLRTLATVGGTVVVAGGDSELTAGLLAFDAVVTSVAPDRTSLSAPLAEGVAGGRLVTAVTVATGGTAVAERTGRTPADTPIVSAVARRRPDGSVALALTGVETRPVLVQPHDPAAGLSPAGDFRGSPAYRLHLVRTLSARALGALS